MPDMTISMNDDGSYALSPPFVLVRGTDREIHWNLAGTPVWQWLNMGKTQGIVIDAAPPPPYSPWDGKQPELNDHNQYVATAPEKPTPGVDLLQISIQRREYAERNCHPCRSGHRQRSARRQRRSARP